MVRRVRKDNEVNASAQGVLEGFSGVSGHFKLTGNII